MVIAWPENLAWESGALMTALGESPTMWHRDLELGCDTWAVSPLSWATSLRVVSSALLSLTFRSLLNLSCLTLYDPMDCSTPGFPVLHHLPELAQTHVLWVGDAVWPSHPFSCPQSFPAGPLVYSRLHPALPLFALYCSLLYILKKPLSFSSNSNSTSWIHIK